MLFAATKSTAELAKVKAGLSGGNEMPLDWLWWFFLGLAGVVVLALFFTWLRRRRSQSIFRGWTTISEPNRIAAVFKRAAARQADCTMELFDHQSTNIYRGHVYEARPGSLVLLELARQPALDAEFEGRPAQVHLNFRPAPHETMEHYQFSSHTLNLDYKRERDWRVARVSVGWPKSIISAQRRDFLRLEPVAGHSMVAQVRPLPEDMSLAPGQDKPAEAEGSVLDISVGGLQLLFAGVQRLNEGENYLVTLDLPMADLDLELKSTRLFLVLRPLSRDILGLTSEAPDHRPGLGARTVVRGSFVGRYRLQPGRDLWEFIDFSVENFQDLAHWINAYQRFLLKKENGLISRPIERRNIYPAQPPARPPLKGEE